ncbi:MAG: acetate/propionate family kinase [Anaerolineae bacterium]
MISKELLVRYAVFEQAPAEIIQAIQEQAQIAPYAPGEVIVPFGQPFTFFGVILEGEAGFFTSEEEGEPKCLQTLKAGDELGTLSLMTRLPSPVDVIATTPCRVLLVPGELFYHWVQVDAVALQRFARTVAQRGRLIEQDREDRLRQVAAQEIDPYGLNLTSEEAQKILVINLRTGSLKYRFFDTSDGSKNVEGQVEWIDQPGTLQTHITSKGRYTFELGKPHGAGHREALQAALDRLVDPEIGVLAALSEITAVGHRVVHGGDKYSGPVIIDDQVLSDIRRFAPLAPLHNPMHAQGIEWLRELLPHVPHVAVFDTAFHQTMPPYAYRYALPEDLYQEGIRRYGFHGPSHQYVALMAAAYLKKPFSRLKIITCHLGEGSSVCAIEHGRSIDTSMGLTPLEGLVMVTRSGDLDPAIGTYLMRKGLSADEIEELLNRQSGLKGLSGLSGDTREIAAAANAGDAKALLAAEVFAYRLRKYIGAYYAVLGGLDVLVFTGGIGENAAGVRALACQGLWGLGILLDAVKNRAVQQGVEGVADISHPDSKVKVLVIHSDASRMIARETIRILDLQVITQRMQATQIPIPVGVSAHHVHLSQADVERLFGPGYQLTPKVPLSQPGQFAAEEQVRLIGPQGVVERVRILGPARGMTQIEISRTEGYQLGINAPIRMSGDLDGTPGLIVEGPAGQIELKRGAIYAQRHIHMTPADARRFGLQNGDVVRVRVEGDRELVFGDVAVRVSPKFKLELHLDTDEANAAGISTGDVAYLESIQHRGKNGAS